MTTNHHTPIATGAAANAATWNAPFGELDAAIDAVAADVTALQEDVEALDFTYSGESDEFLNGNGSFAVPAGTGSTNGHVIQADGSPLTQRTNLNFTDGLVAEDSESGTVVSLSAEETPTWITATLEGSWAHGDDDVQYYKDRSGIVHLKGSATLASWTSTPSMVFQLPAGYRNPSGESTRVVPLVISCSGLSPTIMAWYCQVNSGSVDMFNLFGETLSNVTVYFAGVFWPTF